MNNEVLKKTLKENKALLNDANSLLKILKDCGISGKVETWFQTALTDAEVGKFLLMADDSSQERRDTAERDALEKLKKVLPSEAAGKTVVYTLTEALGWKDEPEIKAPGDDTTSGTSNSDMKKDKSEVRSEDKEGSSSNEINESDASDDNKTEKQSADSDSDTKKNEAESLSDKKDESPEESNASSQNSTEKNIEDFYNDGINAMNLGEDQKAMESFNHALEMSPSYTNAYNMRATLYAKNGQYDLAIADYGKIIEQNADNVSAYRNRGICYYESEKFGEALIDFDKVLKKDPDDQKIIDMRQKILDKIEQPWHENGWKDKFFSTQGRLNRKRYFLRGLIIGLIQAIVLGLNNIFLRLNENTEITIYFFLFFLFVVSMVSHITLIIRRAHDVNKKGQWSISFVFQYIYLLSGALLSLAIKLEWWTLFDYVMLFYYDLSWITIFSTPFALYLLFKKGTVGANRFGVDPLNGKTDNSFGVKEKIIASFFAGIIAVFLCIFLYGQHNHELAREHYEQGLSYSKDEEYDKALAEFDKAINLDSAYAEAYYNR